VEWLAPLVAFGFVCTVTPGPNNILLWASGAAFGVRRTWPHVIGTALGVGMLGLLVAAGLGVLVTTIPPLGFAMKLGGSIYLLYLAWQVAGAGALERATAARPMGLFQAIAFQLVNPKVWIFALGAMATFRPASLPVVVGSVIVAIVMMAVAIPSSAVWAVGGETIDRLIERPTTRRAVSLTLALLVVATVALVWI
jgi:threonine/homoserine/homoserine lactone efflux protein